MSIQSLGAFEIPGYQTIEVVRDFAGITYLYMGADYVAFSPEQWDYFAFCLASTRDTRTCAFPGDHEHDHSMCQDAVEDYERNLQ